jgi:hypothetical protein
MTNNVTPINGRTKRGTFQKGVSGNPYGVSAQERAIKEMQKHNEELLSTLITANVPAAVKLHKAMLKNGRKMTDKDAIHLIELTYKYGLGTPRQVEQNKQDSGDDRSVVEIVSEMPEEKRQAMIDILNNTSKDATSE